RASRSRSGEIVLLAETTIDAASDLSRSRTLHLARTAAQQDRERDLGMGFVGIRDEPTYARGWVVAGAGFAKRHFVPATIVTALTGAIENGCQHAFANFRKKWGDIQISFHARSETLNLFGSPRILQVIQRAAVGKCRCKRSKLQWSDLNALTEAG